MIDLTPVSISLLSLLCILLSGLLSSCQTSPKPIEPPQLHQQWELQPGQEIKGYRVISGLGDLSIDLKGKSIYAPFTGKTAIDTHDCLYFETPEVPNYKLRFCGIQQPQLGDVKQGDRMANADLLRFATLRKHPSGKWAIVEPSKQILERLLTTS